MGFFEELESFPGTNQY